MIRIFLVLLTAGLFSLANCQEIEITTKGVYFPIESDNPKTQEIDLEIFEKENRFESKYPELSPIFLTNKLEIRLKNNKKDTLLFLFPNHLRLGSITNDSILLDNLNAILYSLIPELALYSKNHKKEVTPCFIHDVYEVDEVAKTKQNFLMQRLDNERVKALFFDNYLKDNLIILPPNKKRIIEIYFSYPINYNAFLDLVECHSIENPNIEKLSITFDQSKSIITKLLPEKFIDELTKRNIKIFDGAIQSNKIPIIPMVPRIKKSD